MPLNWKEDYATYDEKIDDQHKQLFRFANKLEALIEQEKVEPSEVDRLLHFMKVYADTHFRYEENCMRKHRCPFAKENQNAHTKFSNYFENIAVKLRYNEFDKSQLLQLHEFVSEWLTSHICKIDIQLRDYN